MEKRFKITIPEPCTEDWNKMKPHENGRFCSSCCKTVIDFSVMSPDEIQDFFIQNENKNLCGRFKKSQLDSLIIQIPNQVLYTQNFSKIFLLALFLFMGTTLFSCKNDDGIKQKIDKIEIIENSLKTKTTQDTISIVNSSNKKTSLNKKRSRRRYESITVYPEPKSAEGYGYDYVSENYIAGGIGSSSFIIYPSFPGGIEKFYNMIENNFKLPRKSRKSTGEIEAYFSVQKDGTLDDIKTGNDLGNETGTELIRVLKTSPKWIPGEENSRKTINTFKVIVSIEKDSLNEKKRKRKFSKITNVKIIEIKKSDEIN